jgi:hypothetical protein
MHQFDAAAAALDAVQRNKKRRENTFCVVSFIL